VDGWEKKCRLTSLNPVRGRNILEGRGCITEKWNTLFHENVVSREVKEGGKKEGDQTTRHRKKKGLLSRPSLLSASITRRGRDREKRCLEVCKNGFRHRASEYAMGRGGETIPTERADAVRRIYACVGASGHQFIAQGMGWGGNAQKGERVESQEGESSQNKSCGLDIRPPTDHPHSRAVTVNRDHETSISFHSRDDLVEPERKSDFLKPRRDHLVVKGERELGYNAKDRPQSPIYSQARPGDNVGKDRSLKSWRLCRPRQSRKREALSGDLLG